MKKKLLFLLTILSMLMLTACRARDSLNIRVYLLPDSTTAYLLLKADCGTPANISPDKSSPEWTFEEDGYVYAGRLSGINGAFCVKNNEPQITTSPAIRLYADTEEELGELCEQFQTCRLLFYNEMSGKISTSGELSLTPADKFGYPQLVDYDCGEDRFIPRQWVLRPVLGHSLQWWQESLLRFGYFGAAVAVLSVGIMAAVAVGSKKRCPWLAMWVTAIVFCLPNLIGVMLDLMQRTIPYFRTSSEVLSAKDISMQMLLHGFPTLLLLTTLAVFHIISIKNPKNNKKG